MRLLEIASAEEQIALFKLVSDSVWAALTTQQQQQAEERAAKQAANKGKAKVGLKGKLRKAVQSPPPPVAKPIAPNQAQPQQAVTAAPTKAAPQQFVSNQSYQQPKNAVTAAALNNRQVGRQA